MVSILIKKSSHIRLLVRREIRISVELIRNIRTREALVPLVPCVLYPRAPHVTALLAAGLLAAGLLGLLALLAFAPRASSSSSSGYGYLG